MSVCGVEISRHGLTLAALAVPTKAPAVRRSSHFLPPQPQNRSPRADLFLRLDKKASLVLGEEQHADVSEQQPIANSRFAARLLVK